MYTTKPNGKKYVRNKCRACAIKASSCKYTYEDPILEAYSKIIAHRINNKLSRLRHQEAYNKRQKRYREQNIERLREISRKNYRKNPDAYKKRADQWRKNNTEKALAMDKRTRNRNRERLNDNYLKRLLIKDTLGLSYQDVTPELIELKRKQLKIYRDVKQQEENTNRRSP